MDNSPQPSEAYKELVKMQSEMFKSLDTVLKPLDNMTATTFVKNVGAANTNIYSFSIGPYQLALKLDLKPFAQAIFMETFINTKRIKELDLTCYINQQIKSQQGPTLDYSNFGKEYYDWLSLYLSGIEKNELADRKASEKPSK